MKFPRRHLLKHPVITSFLWFKWERIRPYFNRNLILFYFFILFLFILQQEPQTLPPLCLPTHLVHLCKLWRAQPARDYRGHLCSSLHRRCSSHGRLHCQGLVEGCQGELIFVKSMSSRVLFQESVRSDNLSSNTIKGKLDTSSPRLLLQLVNSKVIENI